MYKDDRKSARDDHKEAPSCNVTRVGVACRTAFGPTTLADTTHHTDGVDDPATQQLAIGSGLGFVAKNACSHDGI